jgi:twitching motility protein PilT
MKTLLDLLRHLSRQEVTLLMLATGRHAQVRVGDVLEPVGEGALTNDVIFQILFAAGGSRYLDALGVKPTQWSLRLGAVGQVMVTAVQNGEHVEAHFAPPRRTADPAPPNPPKRTKSRTGAHPLRAPGRRISRPALDASGARRLTPAPTGAGPAGAVGPAQTSAQATAQASAQAPIIEDTAALEGAGKQHRQTLRSPMVADSTFGHDPSAMRAPVAPVAPVAPAAPAAPAAPVAAHRTPLGRLLVEARKAHASDLQLVACRPPLFRVGGALFSIGDPVEAATLEAMLVDHVPPRLGAALAADGSCHFALDLGPLGRFRVNVARQHTGLKASFRVIPIETPTLASLGMPESIAAAARHAQGLIVIAGPAGQGKTSTLAAIVDILNSDTTRHVLTVEDPVEHLHLRKKAIVSQREVGTHCRSLQAALEASRCQDPDVIVIGELRDTEALRLALSAVEAGHLVLGTMSTPNAAKTIDRIIDCFPAPEQHQVRTTLAGGLRLVVAQRLLPAADKARRLAAAELLPGSPALSALIRDGNTAQIPAFQRGRGIGGVRLDDSLAELVTTGKTTLAAALMVAEAPEELEAALHGGGVDSTSRRDPAAPAQEVVRRAPSWPAPPSERPSDRMDPGTGVTARGLLQKAGAFFSKKGS